VCDETNRSSFRFAPQPFGSYKRVACTNQFSTHMYIYCPDERRREQTPVCSMINDRRGVGINDISCLIRNIAYRYFERITFAEIVRGTLSTRKTVSRYEKRKRTFAATTNLYRNARGKCRGAGERSFFRRPVSQTVARGFCDST